MLRSLGSRGIILRLNTNCCWYGANPSHNNYRCLCETASCAPPADSHIKSRRLIKAGMPLIRRATLEGWHLWPSELVARRDFEKEKKKAQNLTLSALLITFAFHQMAVWFDLLHLGTGLETWFAFLPWQKAHQGLASDVVWENATSARGMLASPASKRFASGPACPHLYLALLQPQQLKN